MDLETAEVGSNVAAQTADPEEDIRLARRYTFNGSKEDFLHAAWKLFEEGREASDHLTNTAVSLTQSPTRLLPTKLKNYQMEGVGFLCQQMDKRGCALLADGKGLGKTIQLIALILERPVASTLVVCPDDSVQMWMTELQTRVQNPPFKVLHLSEDDDPQPSVECLKSFDVVVCSYTYIQDKHSALRKYFKKSKQQKEAFTEKRPKTAVLATSWGRVIVDEAHAIHNIKSCTNAAVCALKSDQRIASTSKLVGIDYSDIGSLLNFLRVVPWGDPVKFREHFAIKEPDELSEKDHERCQAMLVMTFRALMLRRLAGDHFDGQRIQDMLDP